MREIKDTLDRVAGVHGDAGELRGKRLVWRFLLESAKEVQADSGHAEIAAVSEVVYRVGVRLAEEITG